MSAPRRTVVHHPGDALLLAHAAGAAGEAMALIVASHLSFCARCRHIVALAEAAGGARLDETAPAAMGEGALERAMARLGEQERRVPAVSSDNTPPPLRAFLGREVSQMRWRRMGPSLAYVPLARQGDVTLRLLCGKPGADVGRHCHRGMEYTLVLAGGFTDVTGSYGPGDFQTATPDLHHNPKADDDGDCINLAVTTGPLKFEGWVAKVAGKLFGF
jgi:putative transcriptional regulator